MTTQLFNSWRSTIFSWFYVIVMVFIIVALAGKQVVSWILMKLYEFFIQKSPVS
ncbi:MAG: hypothetical protein ABUT20_20020 [Bacteroidota bacterium]